MRMLQCGSEIEIEIDQKWPEILVSESFRLVQFSDHFRNVFFFDTSFSKLIKFLINDLKVKYGSKNFEVEKVPILDRKSYKPFEFSFRAPLARK